MVFVAIAEKAVQIHQDAQSVHFALGGNKTLILRRINNREEELI